MTNFYNKYIINIGDSMINKKIESYFDSTKTLQNKIANIECISVMILLIGNIIIFSILDINKLLIYFTIGVLICLIIIFFLLIKQKKYIFIHC